MGEDGSCGLSKPKVGNSVFLSQHLVFLLKSRISEKRHPERKLVERALAGIPGRHTLTYS